MAKEYFCAYHSYLKSIRNLSDAECGRLFKALLQYSAGEVLINLQGREGIAFDFICEQIDRDNEKYAQKCEKNRENGAKSTERTPPNATERPRTPPKEKEKEKEKDIHPSDVIPPKSPQGAIDGLFDQFWKAYPKKVGKGEARKAFGKLKPTEKLTDQLVIAIGEQKLSEQWQRENGRYIPNPATWLNQGRWGDELTPAICQDVSFDLAAAFRMMEENSNGSNR